MSLCHWNAVLSHADSFNAMKKKTHKKTLWYNLFDKRSVIHIDQKLQLADTRFEVLYNKFVFALFAWVINEDTT